MYTFELSDRFLSNEERAIFKNYLEYYHLDENIWDVFGCLFASKSKGASPIMLRAYENSLLCGAAILIKCSKYGRSLFDDRFLAGIINHFSPPFYLWIKYGCCMDMMSNPGFVADQEKVDEINNAMAMYLKKKCLLTMIYDYTGKSYLYTGSDKLPSPPHALIDTAGIMSVQDYIKEHKYIKRKMNIFTNNGGTFEIISGVLDADTVTSLKKCFIATSEKSLFYLPYQDLYLHSAIKTSNTHLDNVYYFVARLNGEFLGYQAALKSGACLNALHGAFNRELKTTFHAYDILFVKMVEFAVENNLKSIDFGSVINITKQRMVNKTLDLSYFYISKYLFFQKMMVKFLRNTKILSKEQLQFNISDTGSRCYEV